MPALANDISLCLEHWTQLLGRDYVSVEPETLAEAQTATFGTTQKIPAVLQPANVEEIQECLRIANRFRIPLYPISSGKNWGYGSRVPPNNGCALLDLSRLNQILDFDEQLGYVTVEPGVTQRQLHSFLTERKSGLWMDATGSSPDCSLIGNVMERGFGHTPMGEHFGHVCGMQVVLPNSSVIETGAARFKNSNSGAINRWGIGPSVDGLFSQSNLGIVTRLTIWLMPKPDAFEAFFFRSPRADSLPSLIDILRQLRLKEVLRSAIHIGNDYKVLGGLQQYPWEETNGETPLPETLMAGFREKLGFGYWNVSGGLYGTPGQVSEAKQILRKALSGQTGALKFLSPKTLRLAKRFSKPFKMVSGWDLSKTVELVEPILGLMQGVPTEQPLLSAYWRKRTLPNNNPHPDRDRCGLLWYAPVAPAEGKSVQKLAEIAASTLLRFKFEPMLSLTFITPRMVSCVVSISYDRDVPGEDDRAAACHDELVNICSDNGYYPYRLGIRSMDLLQEPPTFMRFVQTLKTAIDPNAILAPGRYDQSAS